MNRTLPRLLMAPAVVTLFLWMIVPLLMSIYFSVVRYNLMQPGAKDFIDIVLSRTQRKTPTVVHQVRTQPAAGIHGPPSAAPLVRGVSVGSPRGSLFACVAG